MDTQCDVAKFLKLEGWKPWIDVFSTTPRESDHKYASVLVYQTREAKADEGMHMLVHYDIPAGHSLFVRGVNPSVEEVFCISGGYVNGRGMAMLSPGGFVRHEIGVDHAGFALPGTLLFVRYDGGVDKILAMKLEDVK